MASETKTMRVLMTQLAPAPAVDRLREAVGTGGTLDINPNPDLIWSKQELIDKLKSGDYNALYCMLTNPIDAEVLDAAPGLKIVANMAVGYNNIKVEEATSRGIAVTNTPGVLTDTTADFAWALLMATARREVVQTVVDGVTVEVRRSAKRRRTASAYRQEGQLVVLVPARMTAAEEGEWVRAMVARVAASERRKQRSDGDLERRALELSREHLGRPRPNTALLGGFAALTGVVSLHSVQDAIRQRFTGEVAEQNVAVAASAYAHVVSSKEQRRHAQTG